MKINWKYFLGFLSLTMGMIACGKTENAIPAKESESFVENSFDTEDVNDTESIFEESKNAIVEEDSVENFDFKEFGIEDKEYEEVVQKEVKLDINSYVDSMEWLNGEESVLHVSVSNIECENDAEILHKEDYIFYKVNTEINFVKVDYNFDFSSEERMVWMDPTFECKLTDITFDGNEDILIDIGMDGMSELKVFCAYVYTERGYEYCPSFETIRNFQVNKEKQVIESMVQNGYIDYYVYKNGKFVFQE